MKKSKCDDKKDEILVSLNQEFKIAKNDIFIIKDKNLAFEIEKIYFDPSCDSSKTFCSGFDVTINYTHNGDKGTFYMSGESWQRDLGVKLIILNYDERCYLTMRVEELNE